MQQAVRRASEAVEEITGQEVLMVVCVSRPKGGEVEISVVGDKMQTIEKWLMDLRDEIDMHLSRLSRSN